MLASVNNHPSDKTLPDAGLGEASLQQECVRQEAAPGEAPGQRGQLVKHHHTDQLSVHTGQVTTLVRLAGTHTRPWHYSENLLINMVYVDMNVQKNLLTYS